MHGRMPRARGGRYLRSIEERVLFVEGEVVSAPCALYNLRDGTMQAQSIPIELSNTIFPDAAMADRASGAAAHGVGAAPSVITPEGLALHPNGWVISGRGDAQSFWLQVQQVGWLRFERVTAPSCGIVSQTSSWIATEMRSGPCPDPHQSVSWSGVLWTRRAALEAHQAICAYQQAVSQID